MVRFFAIWRVNPTSEWPTDPSKQLELFEMFWASMDQQIKKGELEEWGAFPDATFGYAIFKGEAADAHKMSLVFYPFFVNEVHEIISFEKMKEESSSERSNRSNEEVSLRPLRAYSSFFIASLYSSVLCARATTLGVVGELKYQRAN